MNSSSVIRELDEKSLRAAIKSKSEMDEADVDGIISCVNETISHFGDGWETYVSEEHDKLIFAFQHINLTIAALIGDFKFSENEEYDQPFSDQESAFDWLMGYVNCDDDPQFSLMENHWMLHSLWLVRNRLDEEINEVLKWHKIRRRELFHSPPIGKRKLKVSYPVFSLIHALCVIWHDRVDSSLGLPRRDPKPDNPLLRFIDTGLEFAVGDERPAKKTILQLVQRHIRQELRYRADYERNQKKAMEDWLKKHDGDGVDQFVFGANIKVHGDS